jgi:5-methylcytosine-specific restriction endonuclease McrA
MKNSKRRDHASPVLVLNASFEPINICGWESAIKKVVKGKATVIQYHDRYVHLGLQLPSVVRLIHYARVPHRVQELTRKNILIRDGYRCQYCRHHQPKGHGLTLDHVIPRSQGGRNTWENLVACCEGCNRRKSNRTPEEAKMPLVAVPRMLTVHTSRHLMRNAGVGEPKWQQYLWYDNKGVESA